MGETKVYAIYEIKNCCQSIYGLVIDRGDGKGKEYGKELVDRLNFEQESNYDEDIEYVFRKAEFLNEE